jgi:Ser/Thr protein kinase RdoA (MazF antagonist)
MQRFPEIEAVLSMYPPDCLPNTVDCLGAAGGFSGARIWRITAARGQLCLRRWPPESPDESRLKWLQAIVARAAARGFRQLPDNISTSRGAGFCRHDGYLWELTTWMPGQADYWSDPRPEKLKAAAVALAQFHRAVESFAAHQGHSPDELPRPRIAPSPSIAERLALVGRLQAGAFRGMRAALRQNRGAMPALADRAEELLHLVFPHLPALQHDLVAASRIEAPLQPCLRDLSHDHVLFVGDQVSGIIDIGSMRLDAVSTDIARLLGSLCGNDRDSWTMGLDAYEAVRPLAEPERQLVPTFDRSQRVLAGVKWVEWVFVERRTFGDPAAVVQRMEHILSRLRCC